MNRVSCQLAATLMLSASLVLGVGTAFAQSSGGSSGGSAGGGASSAGASRGSNGSGSVGAPAPRVGGTSTGVNPATTAANPMLRSNSPSAGDPRSLSNQPATTAAPGSTAPGTYSAGGTPVPAGTTTPSGTAYPSGEALGGARQRALQSPSGTAIPPAESGLGTDSEQGTPGLPNTADPNRGSASTSGDPSRLSGGGRANREGARGANLNDCEAAWDKETHMSKDRWRETCRRTLTDPHL